MEHVVYQRRRQAVLEALPSGLLVLFSAPETLRNNDVHHAYRQDSDFFYLTGFEEPGSALVLETHSEAPCTLFVRPRAPELEQWNGLRLGPERAAQELGADAAYAIDELPERLSQAFQRHQRVYACFDGQGEGEQQIWSAVAKARRAARRGGHYPSEFHQAGNVLHPLRRLKQGEELVLMARAAEISAEAHCHAMRLARPGMHEYELEAAVREVFCRCGAARVAYEPIVASGNNANVLHYVSNRDAMQEGDLLLLDAGCELQYYAADITRTFPVSGRFTEPQRRVYELVLNAQLAAIDACGPGKTMSQVHRAAVETLSRGLIQLGILSASLEEVLEKELFKPFYPHKTSHYLGMDVHDVGPYFRGSEELPLDPGVVLTVEPGLYFPADAPACPDVYRGIGVRIEDDVVIEAAGARVLSLGVPKQVSEIEALCSQ